MTKKQALEKIGEILDPDLGISIVELGLIYNVTVKDALIEVLMTLTTPMCPLASTLEGLIKDKLAGSGVERVQVSFTFDPPWSIDRISEETKLKLGLFT
ncbi:MAG: hypothetical protein A2722_02180 [Candidatus Doudnabacteria bacterium RIFCSPHIGHO2_01_FULL_50_11]|uniref:MIP18 family-like domain-containing protein n=1 Tax=Candidatus Doudnabacteria bacterium RIFCSPHIGHO2_01_FULL_50_11 TaxID=1817828 RepID=A0A1F5PI89_9BACT|nr:MAG: hypothetical protein A2722_02180 [Candidatus Doudnabacteria bacterium RIFCSPHIGHO2_01_FULL_50_11]HLC45205.1 metal-sulfur cluster assembly factor [Patescibacteria group bacterium]